MEIRKPTGVRAPAQTSSDVAERDGGTSPPPAQRQSLRRPTALQYLVMGLAASSLPRTTMATPLRAQFAQSFQLAPRDPTGRAPHEPIPARAQTIIDQLLAKHDLAPPDTRPQEQLPKIDEAPGCFSHGQDAEDAFLRWAKDVDLHTAPALQMKQEFGLHFAIEEQGLLVDALISASPTLVRQLKETRQKAMVVEWGDSSFFEDDRKLINLSSQLNLEHAEKTMMAEQTVNFMSHLSHEVAHALSRISIASPGKFQNYEAFKKAFLNGLAKGEAIATYGELSVAKEIHEATGVILPVGLANYRCGRAQAIFHAKTLSQKQKIQALARYMRKVHPAFKKEYVEMAEQHWESIPSAK